MLREKRTRFTAIKTSSQGNMPMPGPRNNSHISRYHLSPLQQMANGHKLVCVSLECLTRYNKRLKIKLARFLYFYIKIV